MNNRNKETLLGFDAYAPAQIAERIETAGIAKARLPLLPMVMLGVLGLARQTGVTVAEAQEAVTIALREHRRLRPPA
jgi:hypothetical protein